MAHLRDLYLPKCRSCGRTASVQLIGNRNEQLQPYCKPCGKRALASREIHEVQISRNQPTNPPRSK